MMHTSIFLQATFFTTAGKRSDAFFPRAIICGPTQKRTESGFHTQGNVDSDSVSLHSQRFAQTRSSGGDTDRADRGSVMNI